MSRAPLDVRIALWICTALSTICCGCKPRESHLPVYPVEGELFVHGAPATGALVILQPVSSDLETSDFLSGFPRAVVDDRGHFAISSFADQDGAPAGKYVALVRVGRPLKSHEDPETAESLSHDSGEASPSKLLRVDAPILVRAERQNRLPRIDLP